MTTNQDIPRCGCGAAMKSYFDHDTGDSGWECSARSKRHPWAYTLSEKYWAKVQAESKPPINPQESPPQESPPQICGCGGKISITSGYKICEHYQTRHPPYMYTTPNMWNYFQQIRYARQFKYLPETDYIWNGKENLPYEKQAKPDNTEPTTYNPERLEAILNEVLAEFKRATSKYPPFHSGHEGFAVVLEEVDELRLEVWKKQSNPDRAELMRKEAIQVAAMTLRFLHDLSQFKN